MKRMLCRLPVVYCGVWHFKGESFDVQDEHVTELLGRCDPEAENFVEIDSESNETPRAEKAATKRRRVK